VNRRDQLATLAAREAARQHAAEQARQKPTRADAEAALERARASGDPRRVAAALAALMTSEPSP
jgi:hypothetical protein